MSLVVLVPAGGAIVPGCDDALRELERRGHPVWKYRGYSAVDAARNQLATDALAKGFTELLWVDTDIVFRPDDVDRLVAHDRPFVCGLYPKKGPRELAAAFLPDTTEVVFGKAGGLLPIRACGFGFALVRRAVFDAVQTHAGLPTLNRQFGKPVVPYFEPMHTADGADARYLGEDYAFCERARRAGVEVLADTTIRLWHVGPYSYGWEDAGADKPRYGTFHFRLTPKPPASAAG